MQRFAAQIRNWKTSLCVRPVCLHISILFWILLFRVFFWKSYRMGETILWTGIANYTSSSLLSVDVQFIPVHEREWTLSKLTFRIYMCGETRHMVAKDTTINITHLRTRINAVILFLDDLRVNTRLQPQKKREMWNNLHIFFSDRYVYLAFDMDFVCTLMKM